MTPPKKQLRLHLSLNETDDLFNILTDWLEKVSEKGGYHEEKRTAKTIEYRIKKFKNKKDHDSDFEW